MAPVARDYGLADHLYCRVIFLAALAGWIYLSIQIDSSSHSASDTRIKFAFNALMVATAYSLVAYFASRRTTM